MAEGALRERRQALLERTDLQGLEFCRAFAEAADEWLSGVAERATDGNHRHLALVAVGGYGRGLLCPFSDLDVVLVHDGRKDVAAVADAIWYPVWDQGVHLDHSVRQPSEVLTAAADDLRVALGLLDGRLVWGDPRVAEPLIERAHAAWRDRLGAAWLPDLVTQMTARHEAQGDVAFLLEPELKESHGGLRDTHVLQAVGAYAPALAEYVDLQALEPASVVLTEARVELHRTAGRELDRLLLQEQDHVATALSYDNADTLMAAVATAGRTIAWVGDDAWRRQQSWQPEPRHRRGSRSLRRRRGASASAPGPLVSGTSDGATDEAVELEPGIALLRGEVTIATGAAVTTDSSLPFRLTAVAAEQQRPIARGALHRLADKVPPPPDPWPTEMRHAFVRTLLAGRPAIEALESLDQQGILSRLFPEWLAVRNKPQRNAFHRFTVDRHLLEAAANAAGLVDRVDRPDLLVLGALLHDIGKGFPGDHTEVGVVKIADIGARMGLSTSEIDDLVTMCRLHLLLPDVATRRDLDDPTTIENVANAVGTTRILFLLGALTEADSLATGPSAWGAWKAGLVDSLVTRTARFLGTSGLPSIAREAGHDVDSDSEAIGAVVISSVTAGAGAIDPGIIDEVRTSGRPVVVLDPPRVVVVAPDRPGLLASVAGILALHGLDVRSADVAGEDAVAAEMFTVEVARGRWPDAGRLRSDLEAVLGDQLALADRLAAKARDYGGRRRPTTATPLDPSVEVDLSASALSTVIEVRALDELGLLHRVTAALFACDLNVVSARVSTFGDSVVDAFYVRNSAGAKITDPDMLDRITAAVGAAIE